MKMLVNVALFDEVSENDISLLVEAEEYYVRLGVRTGTYREFVEAMLGDDEVYSDLIAGDIPRNFLTFMAALAQRWNDHMSADVFPSPGG